MARDVVTVQWDDAAVKLSTEDPHNAIGRGMALLADTAVLAMKARAPVYHGPPRGPTRNHPRQAERRSGTLRSSIQKFRQPDGSYLIGPADQVAPGVFLGALIEHGTPPHRITSHGTWPLYNAATGRAFGRSVMHPGTRPRPFIEPAARQLNGMRITLH